MPHSYADLPTPQPPAPVPPTVHGCRDDGGDASPDPLSPPRLPETTLGDRGGTLPPPLEITAQTAYPEDNVRDAAYFRYLERLRTGESGSEHEDWTAAEREVLRG